MYVFIHRFRMNDHKNKLAVLRVQISRARKTGNQPLLDQLEGERKVLKKMKRVSRQVKRVVQEIPEEDYFDSDDGTVPAVPCTTAPVLTSSTFSVSTAPAFVPIIPVSTSPVAARVSTTPTMNSSSSLSSLSSNSNSSSSSGSIGSNFSTPVRGSTIVSDRGSPNGTEIVLKTFPTLNEARAYSRLEDRFKSTGGTGRSKIRGHYKCAAEGCPCVRKVLPTVDGFEVVQYEEHNHHEKAQGTRAFLKPEEKVLADKFCQLGLPPIKFQMAMESFSAPVSEAQSKHLVSRFNRPRKPQDFVEWLETTGMDLTSRTSKVMGTKVVDRDFAVLMSSPELLFVDIVEDDVLSLDGTFEHCKTSTLLMLSLVHNGRVDQMHKHHVLAFGVVSGHEPTHTVKWFLDLILQARNKPFGTLLWKVDGSLALREGVRLCYHSSTPPKVGMDYFHVVCMAFETRK
jgi:hypothetical protein